MKPHRRNRWVWLIAGAVVLVGGALLIAGNLPALVEQSDSSGRRPAPPPTNFEPVDTDAAREATVISVHDGDTVHIYLDGADTTVRLLGIDTPEVGDNLECYGDEAAELLRSLLPEGSVVRALADRDPLDRFGRSLLHLFTDDGIHVNLALLQKGAAEELTLGRNTLYSDEFAAAEADAREAGAGRWSACG